MVVFLLPKKYFLKQILKDLSWCSNRQERRKIYYLFLKISMLASYCEKKYLLKIVILKIFIWQ